LALSKPNILLKKAMENIISEISLVYERKKCSYEKITCSIDASEAARSFYLGNNAQLDLKEYFYVILLNRANQILGYHMLSEGGICGTVADIRLAFATALKSASSGIILVHNHPSGQLKPSEQDIKLTKRFKQAGELLEVPVLDHIILTKDSYYSFSDNGALT
jgi:DNA repair protein RadC